MRDTEKKLIAIPSDTPWPTADQVEKTIRKTGMTFKDLSIEQAITAVIMAYKANAMARETAAS